VSFSYPVMLDLGDVPVLVVGGGLVATRKAEGLVAAGARVTVVAPLVREELVAIAAEVRRRAYQPSDIDGHRLVMTATDDPEVNARVADDATRAGVWVNSADDPANCTFILPAVARRGPLVVSVSSGGASPALATHLRDEILHCVLAPGVEQAAEELAAHRSALKADGVSTESVQWGDRVRAALARWRVTPPAAERSCSGGRG